MKQGSGMVAAVRILWFVIAAPAALVVAVLYVVGAVCFALGGAVSTAVLSLGKEGQ